MYVYVRIVETLSFGRCFPFLVTVRLHLTGIVRCVFIKKRKSKKGWNNPIFQKDFLILRFVDGSTVCYDLVCLAIFTGQRNIGVVIYFLLYNCIFNTFISTRSHPDFTFPKWQILRMFFKGLSFEPTIQMTGRSRLNFIPQTETIFVNKIKAVCYNCLPRPRNLFK